jgi:hypothetical protein
VPKVAASKKIRLASTPKEGSLTAASDKKLERRSKEKKAGLLLFISTGRRISCQEEVSAESVAESHLLGGN